VEPGNAVEAAEPLLRQAEPQVMHSQPQAGNEAISKSLFYAGFHLKLTRMSPVPEVLSLRRRRYANGGNRPSDFSPSHKKKLDIF